MPDETSMPKLTPEARQSVLQWLCEGLRNKEILERLQADFAVTVTRQAIDCYRNKWSDEIQEAQAEAEHRAKQQGLSNRLRRISLLETLAEKLSGAAIDETPRNAKDLSPEVRALLRDIRDEYGDLKERQELTGPGGGPQEHSVMLNVAELKAIAEANREAAERLDGDEPDDTGGDEG